MPISPIPPINAIELKINTDYGCILRLLSRTERKLFRLGAIDIQIITAIKLQQVLIVCNYHGAVVGYACWAFVSDEVAEELSTNPERLLHPSEWNEGLNLWLVDLVALPGALPNLVHVLKNQIFKPVERLQAVRTTREGTIKRRVQIRRVGGRNL